jgi:hypothetical protein
LDLNSIEIHATLVLFQLIILGWVLLAEICEELEIHKLQNSAIELQEGAHDLVVNIKR